MDIGAGGFAPRDSLHRIWSIDVLEEFVFHERIDLPAPYTVEDLRTNFLQTLSILVWGQWTDWPHFDSIFLVPHGPDRTDRGIPDYDIQTLANNDFLGPPAGNRFYDDRHLFCPIDVVENGNVTRDGTWKLPFLEGMSEPCGSGGFGRVTKQVIAARHYVSEGGQISTVRSPFEPVIGTDLANQRLTPYFRPRKVLLAKHLDPKTTFTANAIPLKPYATAKTRMRASSCPWQRLLLETSPTSSSPWLKWIWTSSLVGLSCPQRDARWESC
jgi:hypothetical protein